MNKLSALIVDDSNESITILQSHLKTSSLIGKIYSCNDSRNVTVFLTEHDIDIIFLDIEMPYIDGLKMADHLKLFFPKVSIIFVTGHPSYALKAFKSYPVDFLTKPIHDKLRIEETLLKLVQKKENFNLINNTKISIMSSGAIRFIKVVEIAFVEKEGRKCLIHFDNGELLECTYSLSEIERMLERYNFYRPHQSYLVPLDKVEELIKDNFMSSYTLKLINVKTPIRVSRSKYKELKLRLLENCVH